MPVEGSILCRLLGTFDSTMALEMGSTTAPSGCNLLPSADRASLHHSVKPRQAPEAMYVQRLGGGEKKALGIRGFNPKGTAGYRCAGRGGKLKRSPGPQQAV
jgi:hypothetical protein